MHRSTFPRHWFRTAGCTARSVSYSPWQRGSLRSERSSRLVRLWVPYCKDGNSQVQSHRTDLCEETQSGPTRLQCLASAGVECRPQGDATLGPWPKASKLPRGLLSPPRARFYEPRSAPSGKHLRHHRYRGRYCRRRKPTDECTTCRHHRRDAHRVLACRAMCRAARCPYS